MAAEQTTANKIARLLLEAAIGQSGGVLRLDMETSQQAKDLLQLFIQLTDEEVPRAAA
jgi:hypothetical protein